MCTWPNRGTDGGRCRGWEKEGQNSQKANPSDRSGLTQGKPPNVVSMMIRATSVPIDRYSYEQVELLRDFVRALQHPRGGDGQPLAVEFYAIDINFDAIADPEQKRYFRNLPTSFVLSDEHVDRLREMARRRLRQSPNYQRLFRDPGAAQSPQ